MLVALICQRQSGAASPCPSRKTAPPFDISEIHFGLAWAPSRPAACPGCYRYMIGVFGSFCDVADKAAAPRGMAGQLTPYAKSQGCFADMCG